MGINRKFLFAAILAAAVSGLAGITRADNAGPRVLVIPFTTLNVPDDQHWVAKAVQEDIVSDLGRVGGYTPITSDAQLVVEDNATAVRIGKQAAAAFVVRGAVQQVDNTVRLTGQMIDTASGDTVQSASVTGPLPQLLRLEDELAKQLRGASPVPIADTAIAPTQPITPTSTLAPVSPGPQIVYVPVPTETPVYYPPCNYTDYSTYYDSGFYNSPILFFSSGFGFRRGFGFHDHFGRDFDRSRFTFSSRGASVGGFNQFHSPRTFSGNTPFISQPAFNTQPVFNRVGFNTGFAGRSSFGNSFSGGSFSHNSMGGGFSSGGSFSHSGGFHR